MVYDAARPGYPEGLVLELRRVGFLHPGGIVADLGTGTGLLAECFVSAGHRTLGVEPNVEMLDLARERFSENPLFEAIEGRAESTGLDDGSIDLVVAGQAFHWFEPHAVRAELDRILRPGGAAAWIWNARHEMGTPFLEDYEALLQRFGSDYNQVKARYADPVALEIVAGGPVGPPLGLPNRQLLDRNGFKARLESSSYLPRSGEPAYALLMEEADRIFDRHARNNRVELVYTTEIYGRPPASTHGG